jgi:hypothetical protein
MNLHDDVQRSSKGTQDDRYRLNRPFCTQLPAPDVSAFIRFLEVIHEQPDGVREIWQHGSR